MGELAAVGLGSINTVSASVHHYLDITCENTLHPGRLEGRGGTVFLIKSNCGPERLSSVPRRGRCCTVAGRMFTLRTFLTFLTCDDVFSALVP